MTSEQNFLPSSTPETTDSSQHHTSSADAAPSGEERTPRKPRRRATGRATAAAAETARDGEAEAAKAPSRRARRASGTSGTSQTGTGEAPAQPPLPEESRDAASGEESGAPRRGRPRGRGKSAAVPAAEDVSAPGDVPAVSEAEAPEADAVKTPTSRGSRRGRRSAAPAEGEAPVSGGTEAPRKRGRRAAGGDVPAMGTAEPPARTTSDGEAQKGAAPKRAGSRGRAKNAADAAVVSADVVPAVDAGEADSAKPAAAPHSRAPRRGTGAGAEVAVEAPAADAEADADSGAAPEPETGETPRRKSRRGRRGGRGRGHKNRAPEGQNGAEQPQEAADGETLAPDASVGEERAQAEPEAAVGGQEPAADGSRGSGAGKKSGAKKGREKGSAESRRMFISVLPGEQVEVALAENGTLLEYYLDMLHQRKLKGNIYKGVIHNIDANLQAAFVNYGTGKNGFLQIDEVHPEYWQAPHEPAKGKKFPPIQKVLKAGQEVLVQVVKEPTGNKGAFLTTWLSLAGRFLVLTPGQEQIGVSRKVNDEEERTRLREMMNGIDPGSGLGVIVRTVSAGTTKSTLKNDLQYLKRLWRDIRKKATEVAAPALVHQEPGLSERAVRDYLTDDVGEIWVDNEAEAENVRGMVSLLFPRKKDLVRLHGDPRQSLWDRFGLRRQLEQVYSREVVLPSGGRLVFDQTEALMAVDINSGKISGKGNFEAMAFKTNMEAAEAIARHLRLRDIGGQVVIDFIEMRDKKHVLEVEKTLRQAMKNDRARHDVARMSSFGLLELVRQRMGSSALSITLEPCPACGGTGFRRNLEWQALQALRDLRARLQSSSAPTCVFETARELGLYLLNHKRDTLRDMEQLFGKCLEISIQP